MYIIIIYINILDKFDINLTSKTKDIFRIQTEINIKNYKMTINSLA